MSYLQYFLNKNINAFFTESAHWIDLVSKFQGLSVTCPRLETPLPGRLETSGQIVYCYYWHTSRHFYLFTFFYKFLCLNFFLYLQTSILCILGELPGDGQWLWLFVLVTGDRWQVTCNMWYVTHDTWHLICDPWHLIQDTWHFF